MVEGHRRRSTETCHLRQHGLRFPRAGHLSPRFEAPLNEDPGRQQPLPAERGRRLRAPLRRGGVGIGSARSSGQRSDERFRNRQTRSRRGARRAQPQAAHIERKHLPAPRRKCGRAGRDQPAEPCRLGAQVEGRASRGRAGRKSLLLRPFLPGRIPDAGVSNRVPAHGRLEDQLCRRPVLEGVFPPERLRACGRHRAAFCIASSPARTCAAAPRSGR